MGGASVVVVVATPSLGAVVTLGVMMVTMKITTWVEEANFQMYTKTKRSILAVSEAIADGYGGLRVSPPPSPTTPSTHIRTQPGGRLPADWTMFFNAEVTSSA